MNDLEIAKLTEYAELDGTEVGEMLGLLITIHQFESDMGDKFFKALEVEMQEQLHWFKTHTKIVQRDVTEIHKYRELEY